MNLNNFNNKSVFILAALISVLLQPASILSDEKILSNNPDTSTYFPLEEGSYWIYQLTINNEPQKDTRDSVYIVSLKKTDEGFIAEFTTTLSKTKKPKHFKYKVDNEGAVFMQYAGGDDWEKIALLHPERGDSIAYESDTSNMMCFNSFCSQNDSNCLRLENFPFENAPEGTNLESWQGILFKKGVGKVYDGGPETGWDLIRYRIGKNGNVKKYQYD